MEAVAICERCYLFTNLPHLFSCNHSLCSLCMTRTIAFSHIKHILTQDHIQITCPCQLGTKMLTVTDIPQLLTKSNVISTCKMRVSAGSFLCMECEHWLCEGCIEKHTLRHSHHQLTQGQSCFRKFEQHIIDHNCYDCQEMIWLLCTLVIGAKHSTRKYQYSKYSLKELRMQIPICDVLSQVIQITFFRKDFKLKVDDALEKTMQKMVKLAKVVEESTLIYKEMIKQIAQRADLLLNLLKFCYSDLTKRYTALRTWNRELSYLDIFLQPETEKKLINFAQAFKIQQCEPIQVEWILRDWRKNTLTLTGHAWAVYSLIQLKDGRIATGSSDSTIKFWEVKSNEFTNTLTLTENFGAVLSLMQLKDGRIVLGSYDKRIRVWEVEKKDCMNNLILTGHDGGVCSLIELRDGRIVSGSWDATIKVWAEREHAFKNTLTLTGHAKNVWSLVQLIDGRIASGSGDKTIKIWEVKEKEFTNTLTLTGHDDAVSSLVQLKDGRLASGSFDKTIKIWEVNENKFENTFTVTHHSGFVRSLIQLKDGRIASGGSESTIFIWEVKENELKNTLTLYGPYEHDNNVLSLIQMKDGRIAAASEDKTIKVWE